MACARELHRLLGLCRSRMSPLGLRALLGNAADITRSLLTTAQRPVTEAATIELGELVEELRPLVAVLAGTDAIVVAVRDAGRVRTVANRSDLEQILINLVETPCESDVPGRRITITSGIVDWPGGATAGGELAAGRFALLSIINDHRAATASIQPCARCGGLSAIGPSLASAIASARNGGLVAVPCADGGVDYRALLPLAA
jgi:hypothetical protein